MADFYQRVFKCIDQIMENRWHGLRAELAFLTGDPEEHHQLVFIAGKPRDLPFNVINQILFRVGQLSDLRACYIFCRAERERDIRV